MSKGIEYNDDESGLKVSLGNYNDLPRIEVYARHTDGLLERIEKGMRAVDDVATPDAICMMFTDPSVRKAADIEAEYNPKLEGQKKLKAGSGKEGYSYILILKGKIPLDDALEIMKQVDDIYRNRL